MGISWPTIALAAVIFAGMAPGHGAPVGAIIDNRGMYDRERWMFSGMGKWQALVLRGYIHAVPWQAIFPEMRKPQGWEWLWLAGAVLQIPLAILYPQTLILIPAFVLSIVIGVWLAKITPDFWFVDKTWRKWEFWKWGIGFLLITVFPLVS